MTSELAGDPAAARSPSTPTGRRAGQLDADVVVVGSGAGGGVVAAALARGRPIGRRPRGRAVRRRGHDADATSSTPSTGCTSTTGSLTTWDGAITMLAGAGVGGGTLVNWMTCIERAGRRPRGVGDASTVSRASTAPQPGPRTWRRSRRELGVRRVDRDPAQGRGRSCAARRALGWEAAPTRRNATDCGDCGAARSAAARGTKQSGLRVHLRRAPRPGRPDRRRTRGSRGSLRRGRARRSASRRRSPSRDGRRSPARRLVVRARAGRPRRGRAAHARDPAGVAGSTIPRSGGTCGSIPCPSSPACFDEPVDMWRGTMQARALARVRRGRTAAAGTRYVIESAPGHPGPPRAGPAVGGDRRPRRRDGAASAIVAPLIAVTRDGGEGRVAR